MMDKLVNDDIPNIRFNVAKSYKVLIDTLKRLPDSNQTIVDLEKAGRLGELARGSKRGTELIRESIMPNLEKLGQDDDVDVRFFATMAGQSWGGEGGMDTDS